MTAHVHRTVQRFFLWVVFPTCRHAEEILQNEKFRNVPELKIRRNGMQGRAMSRRIGQEENFSFLAFRFGKVPSINNAWWFLSKGKWLEGAGWRRQLVPICKRKELKIFAKSCVGAGTVLWCCTHPRHLKVITLELIHNYLRPCHQSRGENYEILTIFWIDLKEKNLLKLKVFSGVSSQRNKKNI